MKKVVASALVLLLFTLAACTESPSPPATSPPDTISPTESLQTPIPPPTTPPAASPTPERPETASPLDVAIEGIGGADALDGLLSFVIDAAILRHTTGEGPQPSFETDAPIPISMLLGYDVEGDNLRLDYVREGPAPATYSEVIASSLGYMIGRDARFGSGDASNITSDRWASSRKQQRLLYPHIILRDAVTSPSLVSDGGFAEFNGVEHHLLVIEDDVSPITLFINAQTGTISKLETMENDHWLRDVTLEVFYNDWQPVDGGLLFPNAVSITLDGTVIHEETRNSVQVNPSLDDARFQFPEGADPSFDAELAAAGARTSQSIQMFSARGFPQRLLQTFIDPQEVAPGIYHLRGSSHHSLVIEQEKGIIIAEAPLYSERSEAVIAWVAEQFPDKSITHVISSHHHRDHSSGLRAYVARGIPVVMNELATPIFEEIFTRPSTILPDALADNPTEPVIEPVPAGGTLEIPDLERPVMVVSIAPGHAADTVFTYVGGGEVVFMGDGGAQTPELRTALEELGLSPAMLAGGHGQAAPFE